MKPKNILTEILSKPGNASKPSDAKTRWENLSVFLGQLRTASRALGESKLGVNTVKVLIAVIVGRQINSAIQHYTGLDKATVSKALTKLVKIDAITKTMGGAYLIADGALMPDKPIQVEFTMDEFLGRG